MAKRHSEKDALFFHKHNKGGLFIPALLLIGIGVGIFSGNVAVGTLVGLGIGFLIYAILNLIYR